MAARGGAAISIVAPFDGTVPTRGEPGAKSASAESAKTEKAEAIASCLDIVRLDP